MNKKTLFFFFIFIILHGVSFFLFHYPNLQSIFSLTTIAIFIGIFFRKPQLSWYMLVAELLLDGNGHTAELFNVAIRTWLITVFLVLWLYTHWPEVKNDIVTFPIMFRVLSLCSIFFLILSAIIGLVAGHSPHTIVQELIPYLFFLLVFPARHFFKEIKTHPVYLSILQAFLIGEAFFSLLTLWLFSSSLAQIPDTYYKWFRDGLGGKITDLGFHMYRIVIPEQLLLTPLLLLFIAWMLRTKQLTKNDWYTVVIGMIPFMLSLSRAYFLAFLSCLLLLKITTSWKRWGMVAVTTITLMVSVFTIISLIASRGQSSGLDLIGLRFTSIVRPETEISANTRKIKLSPIVEKIQTHPFLGSGLGSTITYIDPVTKKSVTTEQFDWGYFQLLVELGMFGTLSYLAFLSWPLWYVTKAWYKKIPQRQSDIGIGIAALSLFIIHLTTPTVFHVFGVLFFVYVFASLIRHPDTLTQSASRTCIHRC